MSIEICWQCFENERTKINLHRQKNDQKVVDQSGRQSIFSSFWLSNRRRGFAKDNTRTNNGTIVLIYSHTSLEVLSNFFFLFFYYFLALKIRQRQTLIRATLVRGCSHDRLQFHRVPFTERSSEKRKVFFIQSQSAKSSNLFVTELASLASQSQDRS